MRMRNFTVIKETAKGILAEVTIGSERIQIAQRRPVPQLEPWLQKVDSQWFYASTGNIVPECLIKEMFQERAKQVDAAERVAFVAEILSAEESK